MENTSMLLTVAVVEHLARFVVELAQEIDVADSYQLNGGDPPPARRTLLGRPRRREWNRATPVGESPGPAPSALKMLHKR
jgi:hypothetical protein